MTKDAKRFPQVRRFLPAFIVLVLAAAIIWWQPNMTLRYLQAISWPLVILVLTFSFRNILRGLLPNLSEVSLFGQKINFDTANAATVITDTTNVNLETKIEESPTYITERTDTNFSKGKIEDWMKGSASWGYQMAAIGFKSIPVPTIEWDAENSPKIKWGVGVGNPLTYSQRDNVDRLVQEIIKMEQELATPNPLEAITRGFGPDRKAGLMSTLSTLKVRLREIDPDSPFAK